MELLQHFLFYSHLLGFAAVAGGLLAQLTAKQHRISGVIVNGARWQFISGIALVALDPKGVNMVPVAIKLGIALVLLIFCELLRKRTEISSKTYWFLLILVVVQTAVAMLVAREVDPIVFAALPALY